MSIKRYSQPSMFVVGALVGAMITIVFLGAMEATDYSALVAETCGAQSQAEPVASLSIDERNTLDEHRLYGDWTCERWACERLEYWNYNVCEQGYPAAAVAEIGACMNQLEEVRFRAHKMAVALYGAENVEPWWQ